MDYEKGKRGMCRMMGDVNGAVIGRGKFFGAILMVGN